MDAKSAKTGLWGLAAGGSLALLSQMGIVTVPNVFAPGGALEIPGGFVEMVAQEAGPIDFSMYEVPSFMTAVYDGKIGETGFRDVSRRAAYAIKVADVIRQTCRGPFTTAEIEGWRDKVVRQALRGITVENGLQQFENTLRGLMAFYENPEVLADMNDGMPSDEEIPMKAQQDAMTFIQEQTCNGPEFDKFTSNLAQAAQMDKESELPKKQM